MLLYDEVLFRESITSTSASRKVEFMLDRNEPILNLIDDILMYTSLLNFIEIRSIDKQTNGQTWPPHYPFNFFYFLFANVSQEPVEKLSFKTEDCKTKIG